jgi:hypothetical protein
MLPPESEWLGALLAADLVVGDSGSSTAYAAAAGVPVLLGSPAEEVAPGSPAALLGEIAPRLRFDRPFAPQLAGAMASQPAELASLTASRITSEPGRFGRNMRQLIYRMLGLSQPPSIPAAHPARMPRPVKRRD